jgi:adenosine deaminase
VDKAQELDIRSVPKIDLHRHLLGSTRTRTLLEFSQRNGSRAAYNSLESIERALVHHRAANDLLEYIHPWTTLRSLIRTPEDVRRIAAEAAEDAAHDHVVYVEFRSSLPGLVITDGTLPQAKIPPTDYLDAIRDGFSETPNIVCGLVASVPRHVVGKASRELINKYADQFFSIIMSYRSDLVVGVDLTGLESGSPASSFKSVFQQARALGLSLTIHAGETEGPEEIWAAIDDLGATRIGHGTSASLDPDLVKELIRRNIILEVCPTSGWLTGTISDVSKHPVINSEPPIPYVICTDNPTLNSTTLSHELFLAAEIAGVEPLSFAESQFRLASQAGFLNSARLHDLQKHFSA